MSNWKHTTLGKIASIITGPFGSQLHQSDYVESGIPIVMPQNIDDRKINHDGINYICEKDALRLKKYRAIENDILYARRGDIEKHAFINKCDNGVYCGTGCLRVRVFSQEIDPLFLSFFLNKAETRKWLVTHAVGSNMPNLNTDILEAVPVSYPPIEQQRQIARVLNCIDEKITTNNRVNDNLRKMARTTFDYWFTQFDFPNDGGNPYRASGGSLAWNDVAKKDLPVGWRCTKMASAIEGIRTGLNPRDNFTLGGGDIRYITVKNLRTDGSLDYSGCDTINEAARKIVHRRSDVSVGDILFASIAPLGRCYLVQAPPVDWDINESVFSIRSNTAEITTEYLFMHLQSETFIKEATACSTGSIFKGIRINSLMDSRIVIPPMHILERFSQEVRPIFALQNKLNTENQNLIQLRDWLLPMLMNGQASVSD